MSNLSDIYTLHIRQVDIIFLPSIERNLDEMGDFSRKNYDMNTLL